MNAWICRNDNLGVLLFESQDVDKEDRSLDPIYLGLQGTPMKSKINAMMDHMWDGFYTGQKRLTRFPALIEGTAGSIYNLTYTGTPPKS